MSMSEKEMIKYGSIGGGIILVLGLMAYAFKSKADTVLGENTTYGSAVDVLRNPNKYKSAAKDSDDNDAEYEDVPSGSIEEPDEPDEFDSNEESSIYKDMDLKFGGTRKRNKKTKTKKKPKRNHSKKTKRNNSSKNKSNKNKN